MLSAEKKSCSVREGGREAREWRVRGIVGWVFIYISGGGTMHSRACWYSLFRKRRGAQQQNEQGDL